MPPVNLIIDALKKVEATKTMTILVVPAWKSASFWNVLFPDGRRAVESCVHIKEFRPHVIRGKFSHNKLMQGRAAFPFLALYMRSKGTGHMHASGTTEYRQENE